MFLHICMCAHAYISICTSVAVWLILMKFNVICVFVSSWKYKMLLTLHSIFITFFFSILNFITLQQWNYKNCMKQNLKDTKEQPHTFKCKGSLTFVENQPLLSDQQHMLLDNRPCWNYSASERHASITFNTSTLWGGKEKLCSGAKDEHIGKATRKFSSSMSLTIKTGTKQCYLFSVGKEKYSTTDSR